MQASNPRVTATRGSVEAYSEQAGVDSTVMSFLVIHTKSAA
jgi:hypothetical protein